MVGTADFRNCSVRCQLNSITKLVTKVTLLSSKKPLAPSPSVHSVYKYFIFPLLQYDPKLNIRFTDPNHNSFLLLKLVEKFKILITVVECFHILSYNFLKTKIFNLNILN